MTCNRSLFAFWIEKIQVKSETKQLILWPAAQFFKMLKKSEQNYTFTLPLIVPIKPVNDFFKQWQESQR